MDKSAINLPRGIRTHNPGNIDYVSSEDPWEGLDDPPSNGRFCRFREPVFGLRAIAKTLLAYQRLHRIHSVRGIIERWAPAIENDTPEYVDDVARRIGVTPDEEINPASMPVLRELIKAIVHFENGMQPYDERLIDAAIRMAEEG